MTKISDILGAPEPEFSLRIESFERLAGRPGEDVRLISDLAHSRKALADSIGLDKHDTTLRELYFGLNKKAFEDSAELAKKIRVKNTDTPSEVVDKCIKFSEFLIADAKVWALKPASLRKQLKENPPKKVMKLFGLRSVDSAIKREPLANLFIFSRLLESKSWQEKFVLQSRKLSPADFDKQKIRISALSKTRTQQLKKAGIRLDEVVYVSIETAEIIVAVPHIRFDGDVLFLLNLLISQLNLLKLSTSFMKAHAMKPDFSQLLERVRKVGPQQTMRRYSSVGWPSIVKTISSGPRTSQLKDEFSIHLDKNDVLLLGLSDILGGFNPWGNNFFVGSDGQIMVSGNLSDVLLNAINQLEPEDAFTFYAQSELFDELNARYLLHEPIAEYVLAGRKSEL